MDNKCADFEYFIIDFVQKILELAQIDDEPSYVWNRMINQTEQTQMILSAANYLTDDMIIKKLPFLTPEEADEVIKGRKEMEVSQFEDDNADEDLQDSTVAVQNDDTELKDNKE